VLSLNARRGFFLPRWPEKRDELRAKGVEVTDRQSTTGKVMAKWSVVPDKVQTHVRGADTVDRTGSAVEGDLPPMIKRKRAGR
jgi:hypothetical protein